MSRALPRLTRGRPHKPLPGPDPGPAHDVLRHIASQVASASLPPRLLDLARTAGYLGVSRWTVRDLEAAGVLARVRVPLPNGELRKLLFDRADIDKLIECWKDGQLRMVVEHTNLAARRGRP